MLRAATMAGLIALLSAARLPAQQPAPLDGLTAGTLAGLLWPGGDPPPAAPPESPSLAGEPATVELCPAESNSWRTVWGVVGLSGIPDGAKVAPNGLEYHPNFTIDLDFNFWLWRSHGLYAYADATLWGEKSEDGVTNARDGFLGTSKREFDLAGGAAWNYAGPWELRAFGYTDNNLNRGTDLVKPNGFTDGFGLENRYYLSQEYAKLGQTGFDVTRADFVSVGYYPSKVMVGHDGQPFEPGLFLRAYLTYDLFDWPCYLYGDATFITERSFQPKLLLFDTGLAARPFSFCRQCEFRLGVENTADVQEKNMDSLWYGSIRFVF
jgi:hypothetical protein